ncbi:MAG: hypothetical protein CMP72_01515 [Flavobacteriales bacterium]|nr:hypothetical protein [Flavobacteriales bacterium]|tara:strand:- start:121 stop:753 length:633 start_codon:yes stop_codon:yes gene_type:complete
MNAKKITLILIPVNIILAFFVYNSISSEVEFNKIAKERIAENVQKLKDLRTLQIAFKRENEAFADNFNSLMNFLQNDSTRIVKMEGVNDTLIDGEEISDELALKLGLIKRDTIYVSAMESIFDENYINSRDNNYPFDINSLNIIPFTNKQYNIDANVIEKGKVSVQVFEISATYKDIFNGLDAENKKYDLNSLLKVGSMTEASLNGNWGE